MSANKPNICEEKIFSRSDGGGVKIKYKIKLMFKYDNYRYVRQCRFSCIIGLLSLSRVIAHVNPVNYYFYIQDKTFSHSYSES